MSSVRRARPFLAQVLWWQTFSGFKAVATAQIARVRRGIVGLRSLLNDAFVRVLLQGTVSCQLPRPLHSCDSRNPNPELS